MSFHELGKSTKMVLFKAVGLVLQCNVIHIKLFLLSKRSRSFLRDSSDCFLYNIQERQIRVCS